jgi:hypothetical protein
MSQKIAQLNRHNYFRGSLLLATALTIGSPLCQATLTYAATRPAPSAVTVTLTDTGIRPGTIRAQEHHAVQLHVINSGQHTHQFSIPDFYIYSRTLQPGESSDISFAPYKYGHFVMTSDPAGDNVPEFRGHFIVSETR